MSKRIILGWVLLVGSLIGWPLSAFTFARKEPQSVLALSWFAVALTAVDILLTAEVHDQNQ